VEGMEKLGVILSIVLFFSLFEVSFQIPSRIGRYDVTNSKVVGFSNYFFAQPIILPEKMTVKKLGFWSVYGGENMQLALYGNHSNPNKIVQTNRFNAIAGSNEVDVNIPLVINPGLYYVGMLFGTNGGNGYAPTSEAENAQVLFNGPFLDSDSVPTTYSGLTSINWFNTSIYVFGETTETFCEPVASLSDSYATVVTVDAWGYEAVPQYRMVIHLRIVEPVLRDWRLAIRFPTRNDSLVQSGTSRVYNGADFSCESLDPPITLLKPPSWDLESNAGETLVIEFVAYNRGRFPQNQIKNVVDLKVYKKSP